jgi:glycerol kinase
MYILALDQGTTSSRALVFDRAGQVISLAQQEFEQILPKPGWVEHDPEVIWTTQLATAREALAKSHLSPADIAAIGVTNQRETTILWDRATGRPVANAMVWQSRASAGICERLKREGLEPTFRDKTGLVLDAYFSGSKIRYLFDTIPGLEGRAARGEILFGTVDSFLLWRLSGGRLHATDVSNASRTLLYNIHALDWDDELLAIFGIPRAMLPAVHPASFVYGETDPALFGASIPIAGVAGDQQAATFGQTCFIPGMAKNTYGTGCFLLMNTGHQPIRSQNNLLTTIGWQIGSEVTYCLEGSVFVAGAVVTWLRDGLKLIESSSEIEALANSVPDTEGVYFVPALVGLGAPYWDPFARGTILGITRGTQAGHIARAALESMAFQSGDVLRAMQEDSGLPLQTLQVDGGAAQNGLLMQFQADILDVRVQRPISAESTALGAAYLAGLAVGYWTDTREIAQCWAVGAEFLPAMSSSERDSRWNTWHRAVERARGWASETE